MERKKTAIKINSIIIFTGILLSLVIINIIFVLLSGNEVKTIKLLKNELSILKTDQQIIAASEEISQQYNKEIEVISGVFPSLQTIPLFIQALESKVRGASDEYTIKFNSQTPITEQDKLFLLLTVNMKTDMVRLLSFLSSLESFPYMIHITGITAKAPGGFIGNSDVTLGLKIYVQNPFSTK